MQQEPSLVRLSELETTGLDSHISQGIDRSVRTKNNLARQDKYVEVFDRTIGLKITRPRRDAPM